MKTINLREYDPQAYSKDTWIEVSDEVAETFLLAKRKEAAWDRQMYRYKAFYSLDCDDGIEKAAIHWAQPSPEEILFKKEETGIFKIPVNVIFKSFNEISRTGKCFLDLPANVYCGRQPLCCPARSSLYVLFYIPD